MSISSHDVHQGKQHIGVLEVDVGTCAHAVAHRDSEGWDPDVAPDAQAEVPLDLLIRVDTRPY